MSIGSIASARRSTPVSLARRAARIASRMSRARAAHIMLFEVQTVRFDVLHGAAGRDFLPNTLLQQRAQGFGLLLVGQLVGLEQQAGAGVIHPRLAAQLQRFLNEEVRPLLAELAVQGHARLIEPEGRQQARNLADRGHEILDRVAGIRVQQLVEDGADNPHVLGRGLVCLQQRYSRACLG